MGLFKNIFKKQQKESEEKKKEKPALVKEATEKVSEKKGKDKKEVKPKKEKAKDTKKEVKSTVDVSETATMAHKVLFQPVLSEKSFKMQATNKYIFQVAPSANKYQVKEAIKELYGVKPVSVNMIRKQPVAKYRWGKEVGKTNRIKRAVITMPEGTVLNLTE